MALVSVIIPAYNSGQRILETLESVLSQKEANLEIIVVDDGSTDGTPEHVQEFDDRIKLIRQKNQGIAGARNTGIKSSTGDFVAFLDHDDIWHEEKISAQLKCFEQHSEAGCVFTEFKRWDDNEAPVFPDEHLDPTDLENDFCGWIYHLLILDNPLFGTVLFRREVVDSVGEFDNSLPPSDDWDYVIRASRQYQFYKLRQISTLYRVHSGQTSMKLSDVNVGVEFRNRTIKRFGMKSPDGTSIDKAALNHYYYRGYMAFGTSHYREGDPRLAVKSFLRSIRCKPATFQPYAYLLMSLVKILWRRPSREPVH